MPSFFDFSKYLNTITDKYKLSGTGNLASDLYTPQSVFDTGYIATSDAADTDFKGKAFFRVGDAASDTSFWEMVLTSYTEAHAEKYALHETMAENIVVHAAGSMPVQITMEGYLPSGTDLDTRVRFLRRYVEDFREAKLQPQQKRLFVRVRNTVFYLHVMNISLIDAVATSEFTTFSISGVASEYNQDNGTDLTYQYNFPNGTSLSDEKKNQSEYDFAKHRQTEFQPYQPTRQVSVNGVDNFRTPEYTAASASSSASGDGTYVFPGIVLKSW